MVRKITDSLKAKEPSRLPLQKAPPAPVVRHMEGAHAPLDPTRYKHYWQAASTRNIPLCLEVLEEFRDTKKAPSTKLTSSQIDFANLLMRYGECPLDKLKMLVKACAPSLFVFGKPRSALNQALSHLKDCTDALSDNILLLDIAKVVLDEFDANVHAVRAVNDAVVALEPKTSLLWEMASNDKKVVDHCAQSMQTMAAGLKLTSKDSISAQIATCSKVSELLSVLATNHSLDTKAWADAVSKAVKLL